MTDSPITFAKEIRKLSLKLVHKANASHIASALSIIDLISVLFSSEKVFSFKSSLDKRRDRLLLSKGHACVALYSALYLKKCFTYDELFTYGEDYSQFMNHASHYVNGVEFSTGALGHALPVGCGKALSARLNDYKWTTFVILSDGELQEGSNWEALMFASHHQLRNLVVFVDYNNLQSLTTIDKTISIEPLVDKFKSFGCYVQSIKGHDYAEILDSIKRAKDALKPSVIILNTVKGKGVPFMENLIEWHYKSPDESQLEKALKYIDMS